MKRSYTIDEARVQRAIVNLEKQLDGKRLKIAPRYYRRCYQLAIVTKKEIPLNLDNAIRKRLHDVLTEFLSQPIAKDFLEFDSLYIH